MIFPSIFAIVVGIGMIGMWSVSYFSDHFTRQLMAGIMVQDYLGLCPLPNHRVEGGGATGGGGGEVAGCAVSRMRGLAADGCCVRGDCGDGPSSSQPMTSPSSIA